MEKLETSYLRILLHHPEHGFYRGTRFDRSGIFEALEVGGTNLTDRWFERYDPFMHDAVCGPAEEWDAAGFDRARPGDCFLKIGVGLLVRPDDKPYDRFRLYEVADPGVWDVRRTARSVTFRHRLPGWYAYEKRIVLGPQASFRIRHTLKVRRPYAGEVYNHNFFTLGRLAVGPSRELDFPFRPQGDWRAEYESVGFTDRGIRFNRALHAGESVYSGNLHADGQAGMPYALALREGETGYGIRIFSHAPVSHTVFWSNHRIACLEPYTPVRLFAGEVFSWTIHYEIEQKTVSL